MPTVVFSLTDLQDLVGQQLSPDKLESLASYAKGSIEKTNQEANEVTISFDDTNLPYLWSVEGFARLCRGILGIEPGIPYIKVAGSSLSLIVDDSVGVVRPYIGAFLAEGKQVSDAFLKQLIQLQEKLDESFGRKREKISIGIYRAGQVKFPVTYKAVPPDSVSFVPLGFPHEMSLRNILEEHPKGKEYSWILKQHKMYPLLVDAKGEVLSFPPIINSNSTGRVLENDDHLFIEATATDKHGLKIVLAILAFALADRGFSLSSIEVRRGSKKAVTPDLAPEKVNITLGQVRKLLGLELKNKEVIGLLEKARYHVSTTLSVSIPPYRGDILHPCDIIEDIGIMYGFGSIEEKPLTTYTAGKSNPLHDFKKIARELFVGLGYQEVMSPILSSLNMLSARMQLSPLSDNGKDSAKESPAIDNPVVIENPMSETYSCLRSWIIPQLMDFLSKNTHNPYPQKVFEAGRVAMVKPGQGSGQKTVAEHEHLAAVSAHDSVDYTEARQAVDFTLSQLGLAGEIKKIEHPSFLPGRAARIIIDGKAAGFLGELHPSVLETHKVMVPVVALELDLDALFELVTK
ncbi:phenylalanine--tRNA ligase subunit beta [Candidatus Woesearchaeota archaeon]|nr:phenylalanine--tRNA ligase subunit beta [Candidatus Woesearchaeota archaeon]